MQKMEIRKDSDERKLEKAGQNADASTEDTLLNKKAMASADMVICRKFLEKAGQNGGFHRGRAAESAKMVTTAMVRQWQNATAT
jgi:hypothetical protein